MHTKTSRQWITQRESFNYATIVSQNTKMVSRVHKAVKHFRPRLVPHSSYGSICPKDSPEGPPCGLVLHLQPFHSQQSRKAEIRRLQQSLWHPAEDKWDKFCRKNGEALVIEVNRRLPSCLSDLTFQYVPRCG